MSTHEVIFIALLFLFGMLVYVIRDLIRAENRLDEIESERFDEDVEARLNEVGKRLDQQLRRMNEIDDNLSDTRSRMKAVEKRFAPLS